MHPQLLITFSYKVVTAQHLQLSVHTLFAIFIFIFSELHPLDSKTGANQRVHNTLQCIHFHLQLPPFRAAQVPSWAMAPRSAPEAFSRRILTSLLRFSWVSSCRCRRRSCQAQLAGGGGKAPSLGSEVQVDFFFLRSALLCSEEQTRTHGGVEEGGRCKSFTNNCNPLVRLRRRTVTCARLFGSDNPSGRRQTQTSSVPLPGVYASWNTQVSALARERCPPKAARSLDRAAQESDGQPKGGSARVPCCFRNRRRIRSSFLRLCLRVSLSLSKTRLGCVRLLPPYTVCAMRAEDLSVAPVVRERASALRLELLLADSNRISIQPPFFFLFFLFRPGPIAPSSGWERHCKYVMQTGSSSWTALLFSRCFDAGGACSRCSVPRVQSVSW